MSLFYFITHIFVVNVSYIDRYEGVKETETKNEKKHLSELLKRIQERKQARAIKNEGSVSQQNVAEEVIESEPKKKKRKKEKLSESSVHDVSTNENTENNVTSQHETQDAEQKKLHKKKKRKKKDIQVEETNEKITKVENQMLQNDIVGDKGHRTSNELVNSNIKEQISEQHSDFIVLGSKTKGKRREVKRVLPEWLANPEIISIDLNSGPSLEEVNLILDSNLIEILKANGVNKLFPVQASTMSWLLKCNKDRQQGWWLRDTCVSAPTGSGKNTSYIYRSEITSVSIS